ncbi:hypothetical protein GQF61_15910 [Sphingobacterium sp. DK4209]|uniref:hypothetical protein n=1 Tax=Sphingobacterium zhuxiongii TaxID=2662364 RepID=UPI0012977C27|nr:MULTISPECIES: hypothetical protein [unclassified Sphingobacterium]MVZ67341.1 hypothetical protein [Sphingobacterium sp. DK4209]
MKKKKRPYSTPLIDINVVELETCLAASSPKIIPAKESALQPDVIEMEVEEVKKNLDF